MKVLKSGKAPPHPLLLQPQGGIAQHLMVQLTGSWHMFTRVRVLTHTHTTSHTANLAPCCGLTVFPEFMCSDPTTKGMVPPCRVLQMGSRL